MAFGIGSMSQMTIEWLPAFLSSDQSVSFSSTGALSLGWFMSDGDWYYAEPSHASGIIKAGWLKDGSQYYYLDPAADGKMLLGHFSVNGKSYYAKASGAVACREWVDVRTRFRMSHLRLLQVLIAHCVEHCLMENCLHQTAMAN